MALNIDSIEFEERIQDLKLVFTYTYLMYRRGEPVQQDEVMNFWEILEQVIKTGEHPILDMILENPHDLGIRVVESEGPPGTNDLFGNG